MQQDEAFIFILQIAVNLDVIAVAYEKK